MKTNSELVMWERLAIVMAGILMLAFWIMSFFSAQTESLIVDEIAHIPAGYSYLTQHDYRLNPEHPPLVKDLSALPLTFMNLNFPIDHISWAQDVNGQWEAGWQFIYHVGNNPDAIIFWARFLIVFMVIPLAYYMYRWTKQLFGTRAALLSLFFLAFSPNMIAHSRYVATDFGAAVFIFISLYYFVRFIKVPGWKSLAVATVFFSIAQLVKFSAVLLIPYFIVLAILVVIIRRDHITFLFTKIKNGWVKRLLVYGVSLLLLFMASVIIISLVYLPHMYSMPTELAARTVQTSLTQTSGPLSLVKDAVAWGMGHNITRPFAYFALGATMVLSRASGGNVAFLAGQYANEGWWYFYPVSFFIKTPIPLQIFLGASLIMGLMTLVRAFNGTKLRGRQWLKKTWQIICQWLWEHIDIVAMVGLVAAFVLAGTQSSANIGLRWMLPIFPFLFVFAAFATHRMLGHLTLPSHITVKKLLAEVLVVGLLMWLAVGTVLAYPHYLAYFNEYIGGRDRAYQWTIDSNLDWGQDLKNLTAWVEANNINHIYVDYFGGGVPEYYLGDRYTKWQSQSGLPEGPVYLAISATYFQSSEYHAIYDGENSYVRMLRGQKPIASIGGSILVFAIK